MTLLITIISLIILLFLIILFLTFPGGKNPEKEKPLYGRSYAHRGLHSKDKAIAENSLTAFKKAVESGYGIELDLQLSADGNVMVFHDDSLKRVCGDDRLLKDVSTKELKTIKLLSTNDTIPEFSEVLALVDGKIPLIVEIKTCKNYAELSKKAYDLLKSYKGDYCIESFDPRIVGWFKKNAKEVLRGQLVTNIGDYGNKLEAFVLANAFGNFLGRPQFIAHNYIKKSLIIKFIEKFTMKVAWTIRSEKNFEDIAKKTDAIIFEFFQPEKRFK